MRHAVVLSALIAAGAASMAARQEGLSQRALDATKIQPVRDRLFVITGSDRPPIEAFSGGNTAVFVTSAPGFAQSPVAGRVKTASGAAFILRQNDTLPAKPGDVVYESDGLRTGADGRLGITLKDDTRLSLDPSTELRLDRFVYEPAEGRFDFLLKIVRGVVAYVSGRLGHLAPDSIRLETPEGVLGIRGTRVVIRAGP
jgi:hypothetical protein